jgi:hypothetical protein
VGVQGISRIGPVAETKAPEPSKRSRTPLTAGPVREGAWPPARGTRRRLHGVGKQGKEAIFRTSAHRRGPDGILIKHLGTPPQPFASLLPPGADIGAGLAPTRAFTHGGIGRRPVPGYRPR